MATFVDIASEDDQLRELVAYFNKLQGEREGATPLPVDNLKLKELLPRLIEKLGFVFSDAPEKDVESIFNLLFSLLRKLDAASVDDLAKKTMAKITSDVNDKALLRLKILNNLYNTFDTDSISRYETFVTILQFALDSKNNEVVIPTFKRLDEWLKVWGASVEQSRRLYKLVVRTIDEFSKTGFRFPDNQTKEVLSYNMTIKYLQTFDGADAGSLASAKDDAIKAAVQAIKTPEIHQCDDLLEIPAVKQLATDATHSKLYELLRLFSSEKLDSFTSFHENNPQYLESLGLSHDDCVKKLRLLSLASLGIEQQEIPYSLIASTLKISEDDVESWVILAMRAGLIDAKLDQLRRVTVITRATQRVFTAEQWKSLSTRINGWKENVRSILQVVHSTQVSARGAFESVGGSEGGHHGHERHERHERQQGNRGGDNRRRDNRGDNRDRKH